MCDITLHSALRPHWPRQGSAHLLFMQALLDGHSLFIVHSGLQLGGVPIKFDWQLQTAWPFDSLQILLGPHGDGTHGAGFTVSSRINKNNL